ncbi:ATP-binding protein [Thermococcus indicus]|uniref:ATP-binding protein n=1 Tax=Thermococcus indicus TaxID=2586643 RepID=A0A4Y5SLD6_9EURY|nr:ATP-binding protein [Thermococcus indicus]QDA31204.1 ATP-binding protein [Thermococcus indicus]
MLFDPRPKERRGEMFDREVELEAILRGMEEYPITLIIGIRRVGKSSLLKAALNEYPGIGLYLDARRLYAAGSGSISAPVMADELRRILLGRGRFGFLRGMSVEKVNLGGIQIKPRDMGFMDVLEIIHWIGERTGHKVILAFDEAQYLRFYGSRGGKDLLAGIAHAYDSMPNLSFVFTGSEVGLLHDFLGLDDYSSPLYGRIYEEVEVRPFPRELSEEFLRVGFSEVGLNVPQDDIKRAVDELDGIPGWLVEFGFNYWKKGDPKKALETTIAKARNMIREELLELERRSPRYALILRAVSIGLHRWSKIKDYVEAKSGPITNARLGSLIRNLEKMGWIKKENGEYLIVDPVVEKVLRE